MMNPSLVTQLQSAARGHLCRRALKQKLRGDLLSFFLARKAVAAAGQERPKNVDILKHGALLLFLERVGPSILTPSEHQQMLMSLCSLLADSLDSPSVGESFGALFLSAEYMQRASRLTTSLIRQMSGAMSQADVSKIGGVKMVQAAAKFLHAFSSADGWRLLTQQSGGSNKGGSIAAIMNSLCLKMCTPLGDEANALLIAKVLHNGLKGSKTLLSPDSIDAAFGAVIRALNSQTVEGADKYTHLITLHFFTAPALIDSLSTKTLQLLREGGWFQRSILFIGARQHREAIHQLPMNDNLSLLSNFVHLSYLEQETLVENLLDWTHAMNLLLSRCQQREAPEGDAKRRTNANRWHHPILGWTSERIDEETQGTFGRVRSQLSHLWSQRMVRCLFGKVLASFERNSPSAAAIATTTPTTLAVAKGPEGDSLPVDLMQRLLKKLSIREQGDYHHSHNHPRPNKRSFPPVSMTAIVCQLFQNALLTFSNTQIEILSGLCRDDSILIQLWKFINDEASNSGGGLRNYLSFLSMDPSISAPHFAPLHLFADIAYSLISILDEKEMYECERPFNLEQLREIAHFSNTFCFKALWEELIDLKDQRPSALYQSLFQLNSILHNRDCRRSFTKSPTFWISTDIKPAQLIAEYERQTPRAQLLMSRMPHVVPLRDRMVLCRKMIAQDKEAIDLPTTVITVERSRIIEDGYRQLSTLSSQALRGTIRVKFINEQGLAEAGIDQDGVFKEYLEVSLRKLFDPSLNLFKVASNSLLYPSSTSSLHPNHLALFQFVGRMLAKAVYEGICVDVQLAPVLLATVLNRQLCPFDELATLDPMLYRNLTYVKHYSDSEDVADLEITFSFTEEVLGKIRTVELISGGEHIKVDNENRVLYIHKAAHFRVIKQTKDQCENFVAGFRSILQPKWLSLFNSFELQHLISGTTSDIDLDDLRRHVQYYGGFHSNHRLIKWLWQILRVDFTAEERNLFLKFVTSCSRPPLLGFAYLEPPFSIRCIETTDDMDQGDTLGSVIRGFLAIKRKQPMNRLPTASTCFNLLKLPNYSKRSVLLEKLRYAIHAETGFELS